MFAAITQFFTMFATLFAAGDKIAKAANHLATWSEEQADSFNEIARLERAHRVHERKRQIAALQQQPVQLPALEAPAE